MSPLRFEKSLSSINLSTIIFITQLPHDIFVDMLIITKLRKYGKIFKILRRINLFQTFEHLKKDEAKPRYKNEEANPAISRRIIIVKQYDHCLRDGSRLLQPKLRTTTNGWRTISYLGAKLWNDLPVHMKNIHYMDPYEFKSMLLLPRPLFHLSVLYIVC